MGAEAASIVGLTAGEYQGAALDIDLAYIMWGHSQKVQLQGVGASVFRCGDGHG